MTDDTPWWGRIAKVASEEARQFGGNTAAMAVWHAVKAEAARFGSPEGCPPGLRREILKWCQAPCKVRELVDK